MEWKIFALGSAFFAALTAIFGKVGVAGINSNVATFVRTIVILLVTAALLTFLKQWEDPRTWSNRSLFFLVLSGIATGLSWLCYYKALQMAPASQVAPLDKASIAFVIVLAAIFLGEQITWKVFLGGFLVILGSLVLAL